MADDVIELSVKNMRAIKRTMRETIEKMDQKGAEGLVARATLDLHAFMTKITHYDSGRLRHSLFPEINGSTGRIFTNVVYAPYEEARGGKHAFMSRTESEGTPIVRKALGEYGSLIQGTWEQTA